MSSPASELAIEADQRLRHGSTPPDTEQPDTEQPDTEQPDTEQLDTEQLDTEQVVRCFDRATGLRAVIAVDDTTLGPGLGGVRWLRYPSMEAAEEEARRLARVMTLKNACADLPYGGAKSVVLGDGSTSGAHRQAQLRAFGRFVDRTGGSYIPGVDMGTSVEDMATMGTTAHDVSCDSEDPSPWTAYGIFSGIAAAVRSTGRELAGTGVVVQGAGHVGGSLARRLSAAGCRVMVADVDRARAGALAAEIGGETLDPSLAASTRCDVLAPCAAAKVVTRSTIGKLRCRIIAGGANDVLESAALADMLADRDIVYVPDFVINAGGVIQIHAVRSGWGAEKLEEAILAIGDRVARIVGDARRRDRTPLAVAEEMASDRIGRQVVVPG